MKTLRFTIIILVLSALTILLHMLDNISHETAYHIVTGLVVALSAFNVFKHKRGRDH